MANNTTVNRKGQTVEHHPFNFTGTGSEYFRIWIVNLLLSVLTLGIYSAWAKVRTRRYLYGHTEVAGGRFDYHGKPQRILVGRLIAIVLLLAYVLAGEFLPLVGALLAIALLILTPIIIVRAFRFNAQMSSWRGIRFGFVGTAMDAAIAYIFFPMLGFLTLGLGLPFAWYRQAKFNIDNHRFGKTQFQIGATAGDFYKFAFIVLGAAVVFFLLFSLLGGVAAIGAAAAGDAASDEAAALAAGASALLLVAFSILAYATLGALFSGLRFQALYSDLQIGENWINNDVSLTRFVFIVVTNSVGLLLTLGFYYPWAKIRMTNFLLESLTLEATDLDGFIADREAESSALGEELGGAFDLDIGV